MEATGKKGKWRPLGRELNGGRWGREPNCIAQDMCQSDQFWSSLHTEKCIPNSIMLTNKVKIIQSISYFARARVVVEREYTPLFSPPAR